MNRVYKITPWILLIIIIKLLCFCSSAAVTSQYGNLALIVVVQALVYFDVSIAVPSKLFNGR